VERPDPTLPRRKQAQRSATRTGSPCATPTAASRPAAKPARAAAVAKSTAGNGLQQALLLANQGHLAEAADLCERHLRQKGPSAEAFHLLGLVREAAGQSTEAETFWRKALYLEPQHLEALTHLALLCERRGEEREARLLRQRSMRAANLNGSVKA
jgi:chemotaxis protein methyltransferase WspC